MQEKGVPLTRENYLYYLFAGEPPDPLPLDVEDDLPPHLQERER